MNRIALIFNPFDGNQKIYLLNDDGVAADTTVPTEAVNNKVCEMLKTVGGEEVLIKCPKAYSEKISKNIKNIAATQYNMKDIVVNTID